MPQPVSLIVLALVCALVGACASRPMDLPAGGAPAPPALPATPTLPTSRDLELPSPASLAAARSAGAIPPTRQLSGAQVDPFVAPRRTWVTGELAQFYPSDHFDEAGLAYAVYRFNLPDTSGPEMLHFDWTLLNTPSDLYVALPDYPQQRWRWLECPDETQLTLSTARLQQAVHQPSGDLYVVVACTTGHRTLRGLRIGDPPPTSLQITGVNLDELRMLEKKLLTASYAGGEPVAWRWDGGLVYGPRHSSTVMLYDKTGHESHQMKVTAWDAAGGEASYSFELPAAGPNVLPPHVDDVLFTSGYSGQHMACCANIYTRYDFLHDIHTWDFEGGGVSPSSGSGFLHEVVLGDPGTYPARLTITGPTGSDVFDYVFTICKVGELLPPHYSEMREAAHLSPVMAGEPARYSGENNGGAPDTILWSFGPQATPSISTEAAPEIIFNAPGEYECQVDSHNSSGSDTCSFRAVVLAPMTPYITSARMGERYSLKQTVPTLAALWYDSVAWDFGGAAEPNTSTEIAPQVTLGAPGWYLGKVTATNEQGATVYHFGITVDALYPPEVIGVEGSDPTLPPPVIVHVPALTENVYISAELTGGPPVELAWEFGAACDPGSLVKPVVEHEEGYWCRVDTLAAGTYQCSVQAVNEAGGEPFPFTLVLE